MKKRVLFLCVVLLGLCGCGQSVITMSEEEEELIADYAAGALMKFSPAYPEGLTYVSNATYEAELAKEAAKEAAKQEALEEETTDGENVSSGGSSNGSSSSSPGNGTSGFGADASGDAQVTVRTPETALSEVYDFGGATLVFKDVNTAEYYVQDDYYSMVPSAGNVYLLMDFTLRNDTDATITIDILSSDVAFSVQIGESTVSKAVTTILSEDLTTMFAQLSPGAEEDAVLIFEIPQGSVTADSTFTLRATVDGKTGVLHLE